MTAIEISETFVALSGPPDITFPISSKTDISFFGFAAASTQLVSPPTQRFMVAFIVPNGASSSTSPAARASAGMKSRCFWSSRTFSVVRPRPRAIIDTWASFMLVSMSR